MTVPTSPRNSLDKSKQTTGRTQSYANTLADNRRWTRWAPAGRRRVAPTVLGRCACTSRDARRRRRSFASSRISSARCNSCTTSASRPRMAPGAPSCPRSPTSSSRAASSSMALREPNLAVGVVACIQTHGSLANWHPHIHLLVTDGGFRADGTFVPWPAHDTAALTEMH